MQGKNISVWRGVLAPPTYHHIWLKDDGILYEYRNSWKPINGILASEDQDGLMSKTDKQILDILNKNLHWN